MTHARSPLRGRYLVRNPLWNAWLAANDVVASLLWPSAPVPPGEIRQLLLAIGGHRGDAVIATSIFAPLRAALPDARISVLTPSWNRPVFDGHPGVHRVHVVDHWKLDRSGAPLLRRMGRFRRTASLATDEIRAAGYDAAIDLYAYYPNTARLLRRAGVPIRVGYASGGDGPHYTHALQWTRQGHVSQDHLALARVLAPHVPSEQLRYELGPIDASARAAAEDRLRAAGVAAPWLLLHPAGSSANKDWPVERWRAVARALAPRGPMVISGAGPRESAIAAAIRDAAPDAVDLTRGGALRWDEFRHAVAGARAVLTVDTVTAHLAGAHQRPAVVLMTGTDDPERWRPLGAAIRTLPGNASASDVVAAAESLPG